MGTHRRALRESFPMNTNMAGLRYLSIFCVRVFWTIVASVLEGLTNDKLFFPFNHQVGGDVSQEQGVPREVFGSGDRVATWLFYVGYFIFCLQINSVLGYICMYLSIYISVYVFHKPVDPNTQ